MKFTIEQHKEHLKNIRESLARDARYLEILKKRHADNAKRADFLELQISVAEKEGVKAFQSERFLVNRKDYKGVAP